MNLEGTSRASEGIQQAQHVPSMLRKASPGRRKMAGGQTPHATLYSAIARQINKKGKDSRFKKADWGKFALNR